MSLRFHEIAEARHRILNPFMHEQLMLLGEICSLTSTTCQLDFCCGEGEMLCVWSQRYGIQGIGVDISPVFLKAAHARAAELKCSDRVTFVEGNASTYAKVGDAAAGQGMRGQRGRPVRDVQAGQLQGKLAGQLRDAVDQAGEL